MLKFITNLFSKKAEAPTAPYKVEAPAPKAKKPAAKKAAKPVVKAAAKSRAKSTKKAPTAPDA